MLQGLKRVPCRSFISIDVVGICIDAVAGACRSINEEQVGLIVPTIRIHGEQCFSVVLLSLLQHIWSNLLNKSYERGAARPAIQPQDYGLIVAGPGAAVLDEDVVQ